MEIRGEAVLHGAPDAVWEALHDAELLKEFIPGCEKLEWLDEATLEAELTLRAVGLRHRYASRVHIRESKPPASYALLFGHDPAAPSVTSRVRIAPHAGGTRISYHVEARLDNVLARLGAGLMEKIARKMAGRFFARLDAELAGAEVGGASAH